MKKNFLKFLTLSVTAIGALLFFQTFANQALMDPSFDTSIVPVGFNNTVQTVAKQSDGKIIFGGDFTTYK
ncbi:TPA: hypothetical protein DCZ39_06920 [Patescibacteria group bacterium]|nr:hypothetical protein [Candidatus Gracilibacteria bacterium]